MDSRPDKTERVTIETALGRLAGQRKLGLFQFKGIPYAQPPVGPMRWRMPQAIAPWTDVREATRFAPIAPQAPTQIESLLGGSIGEQSEDCLYLNVWTPGCDGARRPVMVWIHGGAFVIGAGSQGIYNGKHLAARDVVVVTINYRLGAFGFLALAQATSGRAPGSGTEGLADQILALHWVKQNIAAFGGDADNITVFGESAGAMSVSALLASPPARGLFHKAIAQSGAGHIGLDPERASRAGRAMLAHLDIAPEDAARAVEVPYGALIAAQIAVIAESREGKDPHKLGSLPFQPAIDGAVLPQKPIDALREGTAAGIPLLTGTNLEEWKLFSAPNPVLRFMTSRGFEERVIRIAKDAAPDVLAAYTEGSAFERFNAMMTDKAFAVPAARMLEAQAAHAPVYGYRFDWRSKLLGGILGSCHALELGFVFGTYSEKLAGAFFGTGPAADTLSNAMMESWVAFARTGNPATTSTGAWPRYDPAARETMIFGDGPPHTLSAPNDARRKAWDRVPERKLGP
ncbi:MAG TPA: carboxylesterase/lipase family protein [Rhizomicrobium sp.]